MDTFGQRTWGKYDRAEREPAPSHTMETAKETGSHHFNI